MPIVYLKSRQYITPLSLSLVLCIILLTYKIECVKEVIYDNILTNTLELFCWEEDHDPDAVEGAVLCFVDIAR